MCFRPGNMLGTPLRPTQTQEGGAVYFHFSIAMDSTPKDHEGVSPESRRLNDALTPGSATINRIVANTTTSPLCQSSTLNARDNVNSDNNDQ